MIFYGFDSLLLGAVEIGGTRLSLGGGASRLLPDLVIVLGVGVLLLLLLLFWAVYMRNPKRRHSKAAGPARKVYREPHDKSDGASSRRRYKRRTKRREHRSRNPTLAQTGGFPPAREDESGSRPFSDATQ